MSDHLYSLLPDYFISPGRKSVKYLSCCPLPAALATMSLHVSPHVPVITTSQNRSPDIHRC